MSCFLPKDAHKVMLQQLEDAEAEGGGTLKWFPSTVVKDLQIETVAGRGNGQADYQCGRDSTQS